MSTSARPTIAVTGGGGFVGRHLLAAARKLGIPVVEIRRPLDSAAEWRSDLVGVDTIVHLAAAAHEAAERFERARDYEGIRRVNALATERLARGAASAGVRGMVFMSTIGVHGDETFGQPFSEASPPAPRSLYAQSKLEAEQLLWAVARDTGLSISILRPTLVYGPGNGGNMLRLLKLIDRRWPLPVAGAPNRRSLTFVGNLVDAVMRLLRRPIADTFIVCDQDPISTPDLVRTLGRALGRSPSMFSVPRTAMRVAATLAGRPDMARRLFGSLEADCGKFTKALSWRPPFSVSEGLAQTAAWYQSQVRGRHGIQG